MAKSALDLLLDEALEATIGDDKAFQIGTIERYGRDLPFVLNAPPALPQYFAHFCAVHADLTFLIEGDERLTFAETYAQARAVAAALVAHGVQRGDRIGIAMRNGPSWIVSFMGIAMAGGCATLLNGWWQGPELLAAIADAECRMVIADTQRARRIADAGGAPGTEIITLDLGLHIAEAIAPLTALGGDESTVLPDITGDDLATILFTSGSTGQSKGAYSRHRNVMQGIFNYVVQTASVAYLLTKIGNAPVGQASTLLNVPLFHVTGAIPTFLQSFAIARKLVMMPKWDAEEAMRLIEKEQVTYFVGVPLMSYEMLIHPNRDKYDLSCCKSFAAGGAPRPREHVRRLADGLGGGQPVLGYGLTETNAVGCGNVNENYVAKPDSTGPASRPLVDLAILDDAGAPLAQGAVGEVCIRSIANIEGYWNNPAATAAAFTDDGYFRTGDLGYLDTEGYLFIVDRKKDIIIRGGENISCPEVEAGIYAHEAVAECAVFGLPDQRLGEIVGAVVYVKPDEALDEESLRTFLSSNLAAFKVPAVVWFTSDPLPVLGTGKLDRVGIRKLHREIYEAETKESC
jgi:long-chain acyl-CoA synthetase